MAYLLSDDLADLRTTRRQQAGLPTTLPFTQPSGPPVYTAGLPGGTAGPNPPGTPPPASAPPAATVNFRLPGQYLPGNGSGYDPTKGLDGGGSAKYLLRNALSHFNPQQGITPDVLAALNSLGIGTFSGRGDNLVVGGNVSPDFGSTRRFDVIPNFSSGHATTWGYLQEDKGGSLDPFAASTAPTPASSDPFASIPSWLSDGLNPADLVRLAYNTYLGREPAPQDIVANTGNYTSTMLDPNLLSALDAIASSAEATQYAKSHPDQQIPAPPQPTAFQNSAAVGQALQRLSLSLPQLLQGRQSGPTAPSDPLTAWLLNLLGVA